MGNPRDCEQSVHAGSDVAGKQAGEAAAIGFTGCSVLDAAQARPHAGGHRRQVVVKGRRVKTVDVHAHCMIPEAMALVNFKGSERPGLVMPVLSRIRDMDEQGIDVQALSINPFWYKAERDVASQVVKIQNEKLEELCGTHPDRFVAFASVALQHPDLAVQQLEHAIKKQGLRGVAVGASVAGDEFSDPRFHPFWAKCEQLGILIFIHPASTPELARRFQGGGWPQSVIGNPLDTTLAVWHLIFDGTLDRFPGLKICLAHGGGYLVSYAPRADFASRVEPERFARVPLKKKPSEYLRQLYCDSLVFTSEALRHLVAVVGSSQVVLGTDHPIPWHPEAVDHILNTPSLSDDERIAILGGTAQTLLGLNT